MKRVSLIQKPRLSLVACKLCIEIGTFPKVQTNSKILMSAEARNREDDL